MTQFRIKSIVAVGAIALVAGVVTSRAETLAAHTGAQPQNACGERASIVEGLARDFKEQPAAVGVVNQDAVIEVFVSTNGTWTIIATGVDGKSCLISAGESW